MVDQDLGYAFYFFVMGVLLGAMILGVFLEVFGVLDSDFQKADKDDLAKIHIIHYYPEYQNCSVQYKYANEIDCKFGIDGAFIHCQDKGNRDGMSILEDNSTQKICFFDITLKEIFQNKLNGFYN